jgi:hypothetical protein
MKKICQRNAYIILFFSYLPCVCVYCYATVTAILLAIRDEFPPLLRLYIHLFTCTQWCYTLFGLVTGFVRHFQLVSASNHNSSRFYTVYNLQWHAQSLLCHHQSYGNGFQRQTFVLLWVSKLPPWLSHSNFRLSKSKKQQQQQPPPQL